MKVLVILSKQHMMSKSTLRFELIRMVRISMTRLRSWTVSRFSDYFTSAMLFTPAEGVCADHYSKRVYKQLNLITSWNVLHFLLLTTRNRSRLTNPLPSFRDPKITSRLVWDQFTASSPHGDALAPHIPGR